jgi:hypothetical protein
MFGVDQVLAMLLLSGTPSPAALEAVRAEAGGKDAPRAVASAVQLGSRWGVVTSVRRSPEHNRAVGGVPNSFHLAGRAVDIARRPGVRHSDIEAAYRKAGYMLIESIDEGDHSHFAFGGIGSAPKAEPHSQQFASSEAALLTHCAATGDPALKARRRPDRSDGCPDAPEPAPRLRPIEPAP